MEQLDNAQVARVVIPYFLRSLLKIERERRGLSRRKLSVDAGFDASTWAEMERDGAAIDAERWASAVVVLSLTGEDIARRLNAFVNKHPMVWLERKNGGELEICERPITSIRPFASGSVAHADLNEARPALYDELGTYCVDVDDVVTRAKTLEFYSARTSPAPTPAVPEVQRAEEDRRDRLLHAVARLPAEKLALLERIIDKFQRYDSRILAHAYKHFSLSVSQK